MPISYVLSQAGKKIGLDPAIPARRDVLVRYLNEAARELYTSSDFPGSLREMVFKVNGDQTITMPSYVGQVRAVRELASMQVWHINRMRPRYNQFNWTDMWRNVRIKNIQALMATVVNESAGVITVPQVENPPIVVTVSGPTASATIAFEDITMDAVSKQTANNYLDYVAVKKDRVNNYDVTLSDIEGRVLTTIPNNEKEAHYQILDVSACPWLSNSTSRLDNYMEVLYKEKLPYLINDEDEFPAFNFDDVLVNKIIQLYYEEQGKVDLAVAYATKAKQTAAQLTDDQNKECEDKVSLTANPHDTMQKRIGTGLRRRYSLYAGRKF